MDVRRFFLIGLGALAVLALVRWDNHPWLRDVPLLALVIAATWQGVQEITHLAAQRQLQLPVSSMNWVGVLIGLFTYYFRDYTLPPGNPPPLRPFSRYPQGHEPLFRPVEFIATILLAVLTLVLTTTIITYLTERRRQAWQEFLVGHAATVLLGGCLSYALWVEFLPPNWEQGSLVVAALLAATWLGEALAALFDRALEEPEAAGLAEFETARLAHPTRRQRKQEKTSDQQPTLPPPPEKTLPGALAGVLVTMAMFGFLGPRVLNNLSLPPALAVGLAVGMAARMGERLVELVRRYYDVPATGSLLPGTRGLLDYLGGTLVALPVAFYCLRALLAA